MILQPAKIIDRIGVYLTPALLILLVIVAVASFTLPDMDHTTTEAYAQSPFTTGLVEGYFTMDSLAALIFAPVILSALANAGFKGKNLYGGMIKASIIAGILLAIIYLGLLHIGVVGEGDNGAAVLTNVSNALLVVLGKSFSVLSFFLPV